MNTSIIRFQSILACLLVFIIISCSSIPPAGEPTLTPDVVGKLSPNPDITVEQPQPTAQILEGPVIAPTVDINSTNINLKQELYFTGGAENGSSLSLCTSILFDDFKVSLESEFNFIDNGIIPSELTGKQVSPYFWKQIHNESGWNTDNDELYLCIYGFPKDEIITIELYTPEDQLCESWDVLGSDYYYYAIGNITIVDFATKWSRCSHAGQWSLVVKSASTSVSEPIGIDWSQMAKMSVVDSCSSNNYISVKGVGYPPRETRLLGVYGNCSWDGGYNLCGLLRSYLVEIDETGSFDVLLPSDLPGEYIVVPVIKDEPIDYGGHEGWFLYPGVIRYPGTCNASRDLYLTDPTLKGEDVEEIQQQLQSLGYFEVGLVDGDFGTKTDAAIRLFQQTNALDVNGIVDETTRKVLFGEDAIPRPLERNLYMTSPRLNGDDVVIVQQRLTDLGYKEVGEVDGYYGPLTESGVLRFQKMNSLSESGTVDKQTWNTIFSSNPVAGW